MDYLGIVAVLLAWLCVLVGVTSLLAAWLAPSLLATPFMRWLTTGRRLLPSRDNQTLMALWSILLGIFILLSVSGHTIPGLAVFMVWLPVGFLVLRRTLRATQGD